MFNKIVKQLNGHGGEAASLEAALVQLGRDREEARARLDTLSQERHQALLDDANDAALDKIEREIDRATVRLEKLNIAEQPLRERLATAQGAARKKAIDAAVDSLVTAYQAIRAPLFAADAAQLELRRAREAAGVAVGEAALARLPIFCFNGLLGSGGVATWIAENDRIVESVIAARTPGTPKPAASAIQVTRKAPIRPAPTRIAPAPKQVRHEPAAADDLAPLERGQVRVKVARRGYSPADDRPAAHFGQILRMSAATARFAAERGAVQIIEENANV